MDCMTIIGILALVIGIVSLGIMIKLYQRTTQLQVNIAKDSGDSLEFIVNLIVNAAADPGTVRRLLLDYAKEMRWRAGVFYKDGKYSMGWEIPGPKEITVGSMKIAVTGLNEKQNNISA